MRLAKWLSAMTLILAVPVTQALAGSSVWKVEKDGRHLYLGGSIHILSEADYPLPSAFEAAYQRSQAVVFEADVRELQSPQGAQRMTQRLSYSAGRTIRQDIRTSTYAALQDFFGHRGIPMTQIDGFKVGMVSVLIAVVEMQRLGLAGEGVDAFFDNRALEDNRERLYLESVDQQIEFLANMGVGREDELVEYTLQEAKEIGALMAAMKAAWRAGNRADLTKLGVEPMAADFPRIYEDLLVRRNREWMPRLEEMLATDKTEMVIVGVLHLIGSDGLLTSLRARGYHIEQLP